MEKLISIVGLTSSGKSSLGIELAKIFNGEIVSGDSRQVYRGLDWCSGKVTDAELAMVRHHLIDVANLGEQFTLFDFQTQAYKAIDDIISRGKVPFLVGGTGLYTRSVVEGYDLDKTAPSEEKRKQLETKSLEELKQMCLDKKLSLPEQVTKRRLIRLLEVDCDKKRANKPRYDVLQIGMSWPRELIYDRIKQRLEYRMPMMIEETKRQLESGVSKEFLMSLGLESKFIIRFLDGEFDSYEQFFDLLFTEERHFAKRQQTWYNKEKNIVWLDAGDDLLENAKKLIEKFLSK